MIRQELGVSTLAANHIALFAQCGYALGLLFLIPLADLYSRRRILLIDFSLLILALLLTAAASQIRTIHLCSFVIGVCSVVPQFFIPLAAQYSRPERKNRNVGIVLSGLLTGILASRVVSGAVGEWLGWREMYLIASGLMLLSGVAVFRILPDAKPNFTGSYGALMRSLFTLLGEYPLLRVHSVRAALAFGSFMCFWASLAFKMAQPPFHAGSDVVGLLGLCGVAGALTATFSGKYIERVGIFRFNCLGALLQLAAWALFSRGRPLPADYRRHPADRYRHAVYSTEQSGDAVRPLSVGFEPHQYDLHVLLFHRRLVRNLAFRYGMDPLGVAGGCGGGRASDLGFVGRNPLCASVTGPDMSLPRSNGRGEKKSDGPLRAVRRSFVKRSGWNY